MLTTTIGQTGVVPSNTISKDAAQLRPIQPINLPGTGRRMIRPFKRPITFDVSLKYCRHFPNIMEPSCHIPQGIRTKFTGKPRRFFTY